MANSFHTAASFGKRQEYAVIAELLKRGFDVYQTLVDDKGIDCIVRLDTPAGLRYVDVQVKARSKDCNPRSAGYFAAMEVKNPRPNYYFIFYSEQADTHWVVPSLELISLANKNKSGQNEGRFSVKFCNLRANGQVVPRPKFDRYKNNFSFIV